MTIPSNKKVVCITGSVWTGLRSAPRHMLAKEDFGRPTWFTTDRLLTDAQYRRISMAEFHMAMAENNVLAHLQYGESFLGVMWQDFASALTTAEQGGC